MVQCKLSTKLSNKKLNSIRSSLISPIVNAMVSGGYADTGIGVPDYKEIVQNDDLEDIKEETSQRRKKSFFLSSMDSLP